MYSKNDVDFISYRFKLPHRDDVLGLPIGQHISVSAEINGKNIIRNYTPISLENDRGYFEVIIKVFLLSFILLLRLNLFIQTYEKGNISKHVSLLKLGQSIRVKGPKGNFLYTPNLVKHITMIAGGTGIAPMIQVIRACLRNPSDHSKITLIYANVTEEDILLKTDLEELQEIHGLDRLKLYYVLNTPPLNWKGGVGFVTKEHIREHIPNPDTTDSRLLICGKIKAAICRLSHLLSRSSSHGCRNEVSPFSNFNVKFLTLPSGKISKNLLTRFLIPSASFMIRY